jgi:hypothetical protein
MAVVGIAAEVGVGVRGKEVGRIITRVDQLHNNCAPKVAKHALGGVPMVTAGVLDKAAKNAGDISNTRAGSHSEVKQLSNEYAIGNALHFGLILRGVGRHPDRQLGLALVHGGRRRVAATHSEVVQNRFDVARLRERWPWLRLLKLLINLSLRDMSFTPSGGKAVFHRQ